MKVITKHLIGKMCLIYGLCCAQSSPAQELHDRRQIGEATLTQVTGSSGQAVVDGLRDISPDLAEWIIDFAYGDVFSRPGLDLCTRELATVAALTSLGNARPQLEVHIEGALNVGCKAEQIIEIMLLMAVYAGFPSALNGIAAAKAVFEKKGIVLNTES